MTREEYSLLFHKLELNRVAFMRLLDCDEAVLKLVNAAIFAERDRICTLIYGHCESDNEAERIVKAIREGA